MTWRCSGSGLGLLFVVLLASGDAPSPNVAAQKAGLSEFNGLVGGWRGVGQPRRGSNAGAWTETSEWVWHFHESDVALDYIVKDGKILTNARLSYSPVDKRYTLVANLPDKSQRTYTGKLDGKRLVLESDPQGEEIHRITVNSLSDIRTLVLFEKRTAKQEQFSRVAEVGYTREGTRLAREGGNGPECVVTGGVGTITVMHKGKTYYVCCTGCKQAFEDDPEGVLAEYAERRAKEKK